MTDHFIKNIEIKDFKCFDNFKAEGFARVNLIGGKNNIGKTAFMEACYINSSAVNMRQLIASLHSIKFMRENLNVLFSAVKSGVVNTEVKAFIEQSSGIYVETNINTVLFKIDEKEEGIKKYRFKLFEKLIAVNVKDFSFDFESSKNNQFIDSFGLDNSEIITFYSSVQKKDEEKFINKVINNLDSNIGSFKIIDEIPQCKSGDTYLPITEMGDGIRHIVSIVTALYASEHGYLFIDEVDNGIHYTALDDIWEIILTLSDKFNVQVFATTHSKECIESFNRVQLKLKDIQSSYFELAKEKETNKIFMTALPPSQLEYELSHQGKFRGE